MVSMDVFRQDAFSAISLTNAIQDLETVPSYLGSLGIFTPNPVRTTTVAVEKRGASLVIVPTTERGSPRSRRGRDRRTLRNFNTVRLALSDRLMADELQNIRAFGKESELEAVQTEVARRMGILSRDLDTTHERHRLSTINGILLDSDGSAIVNYFTEFGVSDPAEIDFNWAARTGVKKFVAANVVRPMIRALGGRATPGMRIVALCGDDFYDDLQENAEYRAQYLQTNMARQLVEENVFESVRAWGVEWVNYRGTDDNSTSSVAIAADLCKIIPVGVPDVFQVAYSPAEGMDFVNTLGRERYAQLVPDPTVRNEWVDIDVASYPLYICTTPEAILKGNK